MQVPVPTSRRGLELAQQRRDDAAGRFAERIFELQFGPIAGDGRKQIIQPFNSLGGRFVRLVAMRGAYLQAGTPDVFALSHLRLRMQLNGQSDFIGSNGSNQASFAMLFADESDPWYWFVSPPRIRTGDLLTLTCDNTFAGEGAPTLTPEVALRLIDDDLWTLLYAADEADDEGD